MLFISIWQRELNRVPIRFTTLYIQLLSWLYTLFPSVLMLLISWLLCHMLWLWLCVWCDHSITTIIPFCDSMSVMWYFPCSTLVRKEILNNDLAILPSHDKNSTSSNYLTTIFYFSNLTPRVFLWAIDNSQAFW